MKIKIISITMILLYILNVTSLMVQDRSLQDVSQPSKDSIIEVQIISI